MISIYIRLKLNESPVFQRMKSQGKGSKAPLTDSFLKYPNNKYVALALLGATAGQGVVWYTGQFYALFFLLIYLKLDFIPTYILDRALAADRHAVLPRLRRAVRSHRPQEDHPRRLPDRRADLLPAVQGADPLREPGARGLPAEGADPGGGHRLQLPHLHRPVVAAERRATRPRTSSASRACRSSRCPRSAARPLVTTIGTIELKGWDRREVRGGAQGDRLPAEGRHRRRSTG